MSDLGEKVFEVQYDVVCRLVPGFVTIGVYPGILNLESILNRDGDTSWASRWIIALIPAYLIGFALEHISLLLVERLLFEGVVLFRLRKGDGQFAKIYGKWFGKNLRYNYEVWGECNSGKNRLEQRIFKMLSEHAMFRSLILVFLVAIIFPSDLFYGKRYVAFIFMILSILCYLKLADFNSDFVNNSSFYRRIEK